VEISFSPLSEGPKEAVVKISSNDPDRSAAFNESLITLELSGKGTTVLPPPPPPGNKPPSPFNLIYPENEEEGLPTTIIFEWEKSTDPDGDPVTYDLKVCEDRDLTTGCIIKEGIPETKITIGSIANAVYEAGIGISYGAWLMILFGIALIGGLIDRRRIGLLIVAIVISGMFLVSCGSSGGGAREEVAALQPGTTYYWKVVAKDNRGGETVSKDAPWSFTTE
jgi:hypothetical protein